LFTLFVAVAFATSLFAQAVNPGIKVTYKGQTIQAASMQFGAKLDLDQPVCGKPAAVKGVGNTTPPFPENTVVTPITQAQGCDSLLNAADVAGKVAIARRGTCSFKTKALQAQKAGAIACIVYVVDGSAPFNGANDANITEDITIPCVMINLADGSKIVSDFESGNAGDICMVVPSKVSKVYMNNQVSIPSSPSNADQRDTLFPIVEFTNSSEAVVGANMTLEYISPSGVSTKFEETFDMPGGDTISTFLFNAPYFPSEKGLYKIRMYGGFNPTDTVVGSYNVTDYTFGIDNGTWINAGAGLGQTKPSFGAEEQKWQHVTYFVTGNNPITATGVSFGLVTGSAAFQDREVEVTLNEVDLSIVSDPAFTVSSISQLADIAVQIGDPYYYKMTGTENASRLITVPLKDGNSGIQLEPNTLYAVGVLYDNTFKNDSLMPGFVAYNQLTEVAILAGGDLLPTRGAQIITGANSYTGYSGTSQAIIRLHTDGFIINEKLAQLKENEVTFFPNPTSNYVNVKLNLEESAKYVKLGIMDVTGKVLESMDLNMNDGNTQVNLAKYPAGTYFFTVKTDKAYRSAPIIKL
jgi:hypothetical protein